ncbi:MAG: MMPL family transporter [Planctomycetes bacterium]|nr:MMPL family transporter [Planctomycetota bacterium]
MLRLLRRLCWLVFAAATAFLLHGLSEQPVDPTNRALKSPDSQDARQLRALEEAIGAAPVVLLAFVVRGDLPMLESDRATLATLCQQLEGLPGVARTQVAKVPDPGLFLVPVTLDGGDPLATAEAVVAMARAKAPAALTVRAAGLPLVEGTIARLVAGERTTIVPVLLGVLLAAAYAFYRRLGLALAVLLPAVCAIAWTGGLIALLGHELDPVAALLDPVLLTIGVAASVHFVEAFQSHRAEGLDAAAAAAAAAHSMRRPALLATATTMVGLWSLGISVVPAVTDFGMRSAFGVGLAHWFMFLLLPNWLPFVVRGAPGRSGAATHARWFDRLQRRRSLLLTATVVLTTVAATGLPRLAADNDPLRLLPVDDPVRIDHDHLAARLGGVELCHLVVPERSAAADPSRLLPFVAMLRQAPGIAGLGGPPQVGAEGGLVVPFVLQPGGSGMRTPLFDGAERSAAVLGFDDVFVAGPSVQIARDSDRLMQSLGGSMGLSFVLLAVCMVIGLGSLRLGLLALLPNLLPSTWLYGTLGLCDRPVSVATAMIGCTMLGLIVDNTLHLLHHYREHRRCLGPRAALRSALERCGRAMTLSSVVLMLGFATAATSRLATTVEFAMLASATIAAAWFATAVVLPLLMTVATRRAAPRGTPHAS